MCDIVCGKIRIDIILKLLHTISDTSIQRIIMNIFAEMLEDRKFYFPITENYAPYVSLKDTDFPVVGASPWESLSDASLVTMVKKDSFVGEHTPLLKKGARK